jgi:pre-mRNA-processing factor SLU7
MRVNVNILYITHEVDIDIVVYNLLVFIYIEKLCRTMSKKKEKELKVEKVPSSIEEMKSTLNPYVPLFIAKTPWYLTDDHPTLHPKEEKLKGQKGLDEWYQRGQKQGKKVTKYRTGACTNCGAMSHKIKDCVERPRKVGAKYTGEDIQQDEMVQEFKHGYDAKRDRWNGYDPQSHMELVEQWKLVEDKRKKVRDQKQTEKEQLRAIRKLENPNGKFDRDQSFME